MRDSYQAFEEADVVILGVSFDAPAANAEFVKAEKFPFALLSDSRRELALAVGAAKSADQAHARRISYLVGADGKVLEIYDDVSPAGHADEVLADLEAAADQRPAP